MPDHNFFDDGAANLICASDDRSPAWETALAFVSEVAITACILTVCFTFALGAILGLVAAILDLDL